MNDGKGVVFCGQSRAAAHGNPEVAITCTTPVQTQVGPKPSTEMGIKHETHP